MISTIPVKVPRALALEQQGHRPVWRKVDVTMRWLLHGPAQENPTLFPRAYTAPKPWVAHGPCQVSTLPSSLLQPHSTFHFQNASCCLLPECSTVLQTFSAHCLDHSADRTSSGTRSLTSQPGSHPISWVRCHPGFPFPTHSDIYWWRICHLIGEHHTTLRGQGPPLFFLSLQTDPAPGRIIPTIFTEKHKALFKCYIGE